MRVRIALGVAIVLVAAAVVVTLSQRGDRLAGTNLIRQVSFPIAVPAGQEACVQSTQVPDDADSVELLVATNGRPRPPIAIDADENGTTLATGSVVGGGEGNVTIPFRRKVDGNHQTARVCIRNRDAAGGVVLRVAGDVTAPAGAAEIRGRPTGGLPSLRYFRPGRESWWGILGPVAQRFGRGKAGIFGTWTLPALVVVMLALWAVTVRLLLRESR